MARPRKYQRIRFEGLEDLEAALKKLSAEMRGTALTEATEAGAEIVRDVASQLAPRSEDGSRGNPPGFLALNIRTQTVRKRNPDKSEVRIGMAPKAFYGMFQERGTQFHPAQPFLRPALDETKVSVIQVVRDRLYKAVMNSVKGL